MLYHHINVWYADDLWQPLWKGHSVEDHWPKLQGLGTLWLQKYGTRERTGGLHPGSLHSGGTSNLFSASISPSAKWVYKQHLIHNEATKRRVLAKYLSQAFRTGLAALSPPPCLQQGWLSGLHLEWGVASCLVLANERADVAHVGSQSVIHGSLVSFSSTTEATVEQRPGWREARRVVLTLWASAGSH